MAFTSWSIHKEDILLLRALNGVHHDDGFYIDVGANSPREDSVTKLFYDHGWSGINVEPSPHWYARLVNERPRDINVHAAATEKAGSLTIFDHPEGGLGTAVEAFADRHITEWNVAKRPIEVEAVTLAFLCDKYRPKQIHFLKIDVEGFEEQVIRGMDFRNYRPWILCIEATEPMRVHVPTYGAWDHLLTAAAYSYVHFDGLNRWYVAREHPERLSAFNYGVDDYIHWTHLRQVDELNERVRQLEDELRRERASRQ